MSHHNRTVYCGQDGQWVNQRSDDQEDATFYQTQEEAIAAARWILQQNGGGELTVMGEDGKIRSKDTVAPGHDPNPPKDKEH